MDNNRRHKMFKRVEEAAEVPMLILALLMIPLIVIPLSMDLSSTLNQVFIAANWVVWAAFAIELVVKTYLSSNRRRYLLTHWYDVLIVIIPFLRPLRIAQSLRLIRALHVLRLVAVLSRFGLTGRVLLSRHGLQYVLIVAALAVIAIAGFVTLLEQSGEDRTINSFPTALWWSATTVTTVGYGDTAPVTTEGRILGVILMFVGIGVFSIFTANIASFFVRTEKKEIDNLIHCVDEIRFLRSELAVLQESIDRNMTGIDKNSTQHS